MHPARSDQRARQHRHSYRSRQVRPAVQLRGRPSTPPGQTAALDAAALNAAAPAAPAAAAATAAAAPPPAVAARRKTLPLARVLLLAAEHVEVRRTDPCAWRLLADTLTALADLPPSGGDGGAPAALWWAGVRDWWVAACFHDADAPVIGSAEELRSERARTARALQAALGGDEDAELAAVAGI